MAVNLLRVLVLGLLVGVTLPTIQHWRSDAALWARAVRVNPTLPRPLLNAAVQHRKAGDIDGAVRLLESAASFGDAGMRARVRQQLLWMQAFGHDVCSRPTVRSFCFSS